MEFIDRNVRRDLITFIRQLYFRKMGTNEAILLNILYSTKIIVDSKDA